jgi:hypothetical protein
MGYGCHGWIYAVCEEDAPLVKIGYTTQILRLRLEALRKEFSASLVLRGSVFIWSGVLETEWCLHKLLRAERIEGEWFYLQMTQCLLGALTTQAVDEIPNKYHHTYHAGPIPRIAVRGDLSSIINCYYLTLRNRMRAFLQAHDYVRIAKALGCMSDYLLGLSEDMESEIVAPMAP